MANIAYGILIATGFAGSVAFACTDATTTYELTVKFNESYALENDDAAEAYFRDYDPDAEIVIEDTLPPIFHARLRVDTKGLCDTFRPELQSRPYVASVECTEGAGAAPASSPTAD